MPVVLDTPASPARGACDVEIGLLNNLGDAGMESVERQLVALLEQGCGATRVTLRLFALPTVERRAEARERMVTLYHDDETLLRGTLDGLFVTGAEPRASDLRDEPFWPQLTAVIDWAKTGTRSTIWSCLAAHAAVLHLDDIARRPLPAKCTGVFDVAAAATHPLLAATGPRLQVCHSRWNGLEEAELAAAGYTVLTRGTMGVDAFVRDCGSRFVFLQGHPEYDVGALGREARRDLARWRDGEGTPNLPVNYFTPDTEAALRTYLDADDGMAERPGMESTLEWRRDFADALFRNWIDGLQTTAARAA